MHDRASHHSDICWFFCATAFDPCLWIRECSSKTGFEISTWGLDNVYVDALRRKPHASWRAPINNNRLWALRSRRFEFKVNLFLSLLPLVASLFLSFFPFQMLKHNLWTTANYISLSSLDPESIDDLSIGLPKVQSGFVVPFTISESELVSVSTITEVQISVVGLLIGFMVFQNFIKSPRPRASYQRSIVRIGSQFVKNSRSYSTIRLLRSFFTKNSIFRRDGKLEWKDIKRWSKRTSLCDWHSFYRPWRKEVLIEDSTCCVPGYGALARLSCCSNWSGQPMPIHSEQGSWKRILREEHALSLRIAVCRRETCYLSVIWVAMAITILLLVSRNIRALIISSHLLEMVMASDR